MTPFTEAGRVDGRGGADPDLSDTGRRAGRHRAATRGTGPRRRARSASSRRPSPGPDRPEPPWRRPSASTRSLDDDWDEQSFGDWDGAVFTELATDHADDLRRLWQDRDYRRPGGESLAQLETRVHRAYEKAVEGSGTTVVVTSRKPILVVLARVLGVQEDRFWALSTDPASVTAVELWPDGQVSVPFVNRTSHLG